MSSIAAEGVVQKKRTAALGPCHIYKSVRRSVMAATARWDLKKKGNLFDRSLARSHRPISPSNMSLRQLFRETLTSRRQGR